LSFHMTTNSECGFNFIFLLNSGGLACTSWCECESLFILAHAVQSSHRKEGSAYGMDKLNDKQVALDKGRTHTE
jgi:hypothetical protein